MVSIVSLSSSPPPAFARSPTPVRFSSSPNKDSASPVSPRYGVKNSFKAAQKTRDGFPAGFTTARQALAPKLSAENMLALPPPLSVKGNRDLSPSSRVSPTAQAGSAQAKRIAVTSEGDESSSHTIVKILPSDVRKKSSRNRVDPLNLKRAIPRRTDWTPPKSESSRSRNDSLSTSSFGIDLGKSFGHVSHNSRVQSISHREGENLAKRRKTNASVQASEVSLANNSRPNAKPRNKSPSKKNLTITGLTTSHFLEDRHGQDTTTPIMQFLASTQARMQSEDDLDDFETRMAKTRTKSKKSRTKTRLESPETGLKTLEKQDFIFASASQLANDESPAVLQDTLEAIKRSEEDLFSDPVFTQQTAPISIDERSPKTGISRFRSRRNLWNAAHRDDNDALLHHDDPFDDPRIRSALTGKDAMVDCEGLTPRALNEPGNSLSLLNPSFTEALATFDIDDITTPDRSLQTSFSATSKRSYSTTKKMDATREATDTRESQADAQNRPSNLQCEASEPKIPPKPNYACWTDEELSKLVKEYGFKRVRARKSMIDKLDEYWAQKYGLDPKAVKAATKAASRTIIELDHGHFLNNVHELAARPGAKPKKKRVKGSCDNQFGTVSKRKAKSKLVDVAKGDDFTEDGIIDIEDIDSTNVLDRLATIDPFTDMAGNTMEPSTAPVKGTGVKAAAKPRAKRKPKATQRPPTPPPTCPDDIALPSSPGFESIKQKPAAKVPIETSQNMLSRGLASQILASLRHPPANDDQRDHQKNPTWHEKILLYDPIVLEDFTAWLNTIGFNSIGVDDEIDATEVKAWCEENGICCLWKGGWRGNKVKE